MILSQQPLGRTVLDSETSDFISPHIKKKSRGGGFCPPSPAPKPLVNSPASASFWEERVYSLIRYSLSLAGLERRRRKRAGWGRWQLMGEPTRN